MILMLAGCSSNFEIRQPAVAGVFYPAKKEELAKMVSEFIERAKVPQPEKNVVAVICPHAGYIYSGWVAGYSYAYIKNKKIKTVFILGDSHRMSFKGASVGFYKAYKTPLGEVPVNQAICKELLKHNFFCFKKEAHSVEHSIEVQLPFLQIAFKNFDIVPILFGERNPEVSQKIAEILAKYVSPQTIFIGSTDLSHYHTYEKARKLDSKTINVLQSVSGDLLFERLYRGEAELCAIGAITTLLYMCNIAGANKAVVLKYANSGDVPAGDKNRVVGYVAMAFIKKNLARLTPEQGEYLLKIARKTIKHYLETGEIPEFPEPSDEVLKEKRGVFVTIYKHGRLRGCIGTHFSDEPLYKTVARMAVASAFNDPRFPPLSKDELKDIKIEISVYTLPPTPIKSLEQYIIGKHGIIMYCMGRGATFLPKVPVEQGWTKEETLYHLCLKAGLPPDAWKRSDAKFLVYETQVFSEK